MKESINRFIMIPLLIAASCLVGFIILMLLITLYQTNPAFAGLFFVAVFVVALILELLK